MNYPKRLIEVDLPIKRISAHSRREKSIRHGHISTLHIWWARRPLAACRAVLCASLWVDPADELCPSSFIDVAKLEMKKWSDGDHLSLLSQESYLHFNKVSKDKKLLNNKTFLRQLLLDFIADFSNWDNSNNTEFLSTSRALTQAAHEALGGDSGTRPLVADPFAGGGAIPLEALRIGADAFASDLNPIAVLINKVQLEYIPKYGKILTEEVRKWGAWIENKAEKNLAHFYPPIKNPKSEIYTPQVLKTLKRKGINWVFKKILQETPIAYLWARTVVCEGPRCGAEIPLIRNTYLAKSGSRSIGFKLIPRPKQKKVDFEIIENIKESETKGTVKRNSATCPCCGYVTPIKSVRRQLKLRNGGTNDARLFAVVTLLQTERTFRGESEIVEETGRFYRLPHESDLAGIKSAMNELEKRITNDKGDLSFVPDEETPLGEGSGAGRAFSQRNYGIRFFRDLYTCRQMLVLGSLAKIIRDLNIDLSTKICLAFALGRVNDLSMSLCRWLPQLQAIAAANGGQNRMPVTLDFTESNPIASSGGSWVGQAKWVERVLENLSETIHREGRIVQVAAQETILPDESVDALITDPPYYDAFPYSDLSDFFYIWLRRAIDYRFNEITEVLSPKEREIVVYNLEHGEKNVIKDNAYFKSEMQLTFANWRAACKKNAIALVVFANKTLAGWEALLDGLTNAGWTITGSWAIDTERANRQRAIGSAALASSIHLICRPRENQNSVGDWRDVLKELPKRIHEWMPRLANEGIVGADAIFACLGPSLEIFSRYDSVENPKGKVLFHDYLIKVWEAVSQEALSSIFKEADTKGFEEDARMTAMWLWTITKEKNENGITTSLSGEEEDEDNDTEEQSSSVRSSGVTLEYDDARLLAQGLGVRLEELDSIIELKAGKARLRSVEERTQYLFGDHDTRQQLQKKKKRSQLTMFENVESIDNPVYHQPELKVDQAGKTVLDRLHQAMLLFKAGRTEALKRFLVEDGAGKDDRFWKLAQAFTALYPKGTDERRWVEAVQTYKKSLGF